MKAFGGEMKPTVDDLVLQLANEVGDDMVYITASDEERHFDLASLAFSFALMLALSFAQGFMDSAQNDLEKLGKAAYSKLRDRLKALILKGPKDDKDSIEEQKRAIADVGKAIKAVPQRNTILLNEKHVTEGKEQVTKLLGKYHFSESRKREILESVGAKVVLYLREETNE